MSPYREWRATRMWPVGRGARIELTRLRHRRNRRPQGETSPARLSLRCGLDRADWDRSYLPRLDQPLLPTSKDCCSALRRQLVEIGGQASGADPLRTAATELLRIGLAATRRIPIRRGGRSCKERREEDDCEPHDAPTCLDQCYGTTSPPPHPASVWAKPNGLCATPLRTLFLRQ